VLWTALLAGGIALCDLVPTAPWLWLASAAVMLLLAALLRRGETVAALAIALATVSVGLATAQIDHYQFPSDHIWAYTSDAERFGNVGLIIDDPPRLVLPTPAELRLLPPKQVMQGTIIRIKTKAGWQTAHGKVLVTLEQPNARLAVGQTVQMTGIIQRPPKPDNPGEFDWYSYCRDQRILVTLRISHADGVQIISDPGPGPLSWLREKTRHLLASGFSANQTYDHAMLRNFVLGDPDPQLGSLQQQFVRTGTVHLLSISGLHVAIIGGLVLLLCRLCRRSPRFSLAAALLVVVLYASVAIPSWPGWRSVIMGGLATLGLLGRRNIDALQMLAVAVAIVLLIHPADLHSGGFQVSFAAVLGLILFSGPVMRGLSAWWRGPDAIAAPPSHRAPFATACRAVAGIVAALLVASAIAWLAAMPLIAYHFSQLNAWSVPAGVGLLPLTIVGLVGGVMKILLTLAWPTAAHVWALGAAMPIEWMRRAVDALAKLPGASIRIPAPSIGLLAVYYLLLCAVLLRRRSPWARWLTPLGPAVACVGFALWPAALSALPRQTTPDPLRITLLSVGAGQCGVVWLPSGHVVMIDAGSSSISNVAQRLLMPYLADRGCVNIDRIILSHGDFDRVSAVAQLFDAYHQPPVVMSPQFQRFAGGSYPGQAMLGTLALVGAQPQIAHRGDRMDLGGGTTIDVLWPPLDCEMDSNNCALVLKLSFHGRSVLFPSDIADPAQRALLKNPRELKCDVLVAPHHGSAEAMTPEFLRAAAPQFILASNDRRLARKEKTFDVLASGYPLYRTSRCGAITLSIDATGQISVRTFLGARPQTSPPASDAGSSAAAAEVLP
jgi:competence protein ComEC